MANDFTALGSAIYSKLGGTAANPPVYYALAPQGSTPPYIIVQRLTGSDEYTFNSQGVNTEYVVKAVSNRIWPNEAWATYGSVHSTLQNAALTIAGFTSLRCQRKSTIEYIDPDRYWHVGGIYRIEAWQT